RQPRGRTSAPARRFRDRERAGALSVAGRRTAARSTVSIIAPVEAEAVASLQELGLSLYEARLYIGLLKHGPQNGNELSRTSSVPSSKVYATLGKLSAAGIVQHINRGSKQEYVCISPTELVHRYREKYRRPLDHLEEVLPELRAERPDPDVVQISNA